MNRIFAFLILISAIACNEIPRDRQDILPPIISDKGSLSSGREQTNMVDYIFSQMLDTSLEIKTLMEQSTSLEKRRSDWMKLFDDYSQYENTYIKDALAKINGQVFKDTLLQQMLITEVEAIQSRQRIRAQVIEGLNQSVSDESINESEWLLALKIWKTMPVLESYLQTNLPDSVGIKTLRDDLVKHVNNIKLMAKPADQKADSIKTTE